MRPSKLATMTAALAMTAGGVAYTTIAAEEAAETQAAPAAQEMNEVQKVSYALGYDIAGTLQRQQIEIDAESFLAGMKASLGEAAEQLTADEVRETLMNFQQTMQQKQQAKMQAEAQDNAAAGQAFLDANKEKEGVQVTESGLQYKVIAEGEGTSPKIGQNVTVNYTGKLIDGTVFDASARHGGPATFELGRVIQGWNEALTLMKPGAKYELYIPADLAYGPQGSPPVIPPNATLIFEVELLSVGE